MSNPAREASIWIGRIERGLREGEGVLLREWLKISANRKALLETSSVFHSAETNALLRLMLPAAHTAGKPQQQSLIPQMIVALIGTVGLLVLLANGRNPAVAGANDSGRLGPPQVHATPVGGMKQATLTDGSAVTLNTATRVMASFSKDSRDVQLVRGEATFTVAQDARPFIVSAGHRQFEAPTATRFNLREVAPGQIELIVIEGAVKILDAPPRAPEIPARRREVITYGEETVHAAHSALVEPGFQSVSLITPVETEARLAWQRGLIVCESRALEDVLADVERYTMADFVIEDEALRNIRVTGEFRTGNVNAVRQALRQQYFVSSRRDALDRVVLTSYAAGLATSPR
jgi:transmembrane sensor